MPYYSVLAHTVLVITAAVLLYAAWNDLRQFKIRNELVAVLAGLFIIHTILSGHWTEMYWNFVVAFIAFLIMLFFYARKTMGGGDLKLLTVAFLWVGYTCVLPFTILLLISAVAHFLAVKAGLMQTLDDQGRRVPFAPSIAAGLIGTFLIGCLDQPAVHYIPKIPLGNERLKLENGTLNTPSYSR
jgi:prepilin peptidase CpaA